MKNELFNNQSANDNACAPVIEFKSIARALERRQDNPQNTGQIIEFRSIGGNTIEKNPEPPKAA